MLFVTNDFLCWSYLSIVFSHFHCFQDIILPMMKYVHLLENDSYQCQ